MWYKLNAPFNLDLTSVTRFTDTVFGYQVSADTIDFIFGSTHCKAEVNIQGADPTSEGTIDILKINGGGFAENTRYCDPLAKAWTYKIVELQMQLCNQTQCYVLQ